MAVGCCELDLHQCFSFSNFPRLSCLQIESPIHLRFYYPIRRNNQLRCQGFHACEEPFHRWHYAVRFQAKAATTGWMLE